MKAIKRALSGIIAAAMLMTSVCFSSIVDAVATPPATTASFESVTCAVGDTVQVDLVANTSVAFDMFEANVSVGEGAEIVSCSSALNGTVSAGACSFMYNEGTLSFQEGDVIASFNVKVNTYSATYTISMDNIDVYDALYMPVDFTASSGTITVEQPSPYFYLDDIIAPSTTMTGSVSVYAKYCSEIQGLSLALNVELVSDDTLSNWTGLTVSTTYSELNVNASDTAVNILSTGSFTPVASTPIVTITIPKAPCRSGHFSMSYGNINVLLTSGTFDTTTTSTNLAKQIDIADRNPYLLVQSSTAYANETCNVSIEANNFSDVKHISFSFDPDMMSFENATSVDSAFTLNSVTNADGTVTMDYFRTDNDSFTINGETSIINVSLKAPVDVKPYDIGFVSCSDGTYTDADNSVIDIATLEGDTIEFGCKELTFYSPPINAAPGETIEVPFYIAGLEESEHVINCFSFNAVFSDGLSCKKITLEPSPDGAVFWDTSSLDNNYCSFITDSGKVASNYKLVTLEVEVSADADLSQPLSISYDNVVVSFFDDDYNLIDLTYAIYPAQILGYDDGFYVLPMDIEAEGTYEIPIYANIDKAIYDESANVMIAADTFSGCSSVNGIELNAYGKRFFTPTGTPNEYAISNNISIPTEGINGARIGSIEITCADYNIIMALTDQKPSFAITSSYYGGASTYDANDVFTFDMLSCAASLDFDNTMVSVKVNNVSVVDLYQIVGLPGDEFTIQATILDPTAYSFDKWQVTRADSTTASLANTATFKYTLKAGDTVAPIVAVLENYDLSIVATNGKFEFTGYDSVPHTDLVTYSPTLSGEGTVTLKASSANYGYEFEAWYVDGIRYSVNATIDYPVTKSVDIECRYKAKQYDFRLYVGAGMIGSSTDDYIGRIAFNETLTLPNSITAQNDLYQFDGWYTGDDSLFSTSPTLDYKITDESVLNAESKFVLYAKFSPRNDVLSVEVGGEDIVKVFNANSEEILNYNTIGTGSNVYSTNDIESLSGTFTITCNNTNNNFACWLINGAYAGSELSLTFEIGSYIEIEAVYTDSSSAIVAFVGFGEQVIGTVLVNSEATTVAMPATSTTKLGWDFSGWSMTEQQILDAVATGEEYIVVRAVYTKKTDELIVSFGEDYFLTIPTATVPDLQDAPADIVCEIGDLVTLTADEDKYASSNFSFMGWVINADGWDPAEGYNIVSFNPTFEFYAKDYISISALYVSNGITVIHKAGTTSIISKNSADNRQSVSIYAEASEGYTILAAGILADRDDTFYEDGYDFSSLLPSTADYCRYGGLGKTSYQFTWTKNITEPSTYYVISFVTVRNNVTGVVSTFYSSVGLTFSFAEA